MTSVGTTLAVIRITNSSTASSLHLLTNMKGLFGFGSKVSNKLFATKFVYTLTIHSLTPWPQGHRAIAIGWQSEIQRRKWPVLERKFPQN